MKNYGFHLINKPYDKPLAHKQKKFLIVVMAWLDALEIRKNILQPMRI